MSAPAKSEKRVCEACHEEFSSEAELFKHNLTWEHRSKVEASPAGKSEGADAGSKASSEPVSEVHTPNQKQWGDRPFSRSGASQPDPLTEDSGSPTSSAYPHKMPAYDRQPFHSPPRFSRKRPFRPSAHAPFGCYRSPLCDFGPPPPPPPYPPPSGIVPGWPPMRGPRHTGFPGTFSEKGILGPFLPGPRLPYHPYRQLGVPFLKHSLDHSSSDAAEGSGDGMSKSSPKQPQSKVAKNAQLPSTHSKPVSKAKNRDIDTPPEPKKPVAGSCGKKTAVQAKPVSKPLPAQSSQVGDGRGKVAHKKTPKPADSGNNKGALVQTVKPGGSQTVKSGGSQTVKSGGSQTVKPGSGQTIKPGSSHIKDAHGKPLPRASSSSQAKNDVSKHSKNTAGLKRAPPLLSLVGEVQKKKARYIPAMSSQEHSANSPARSPKNHEPEPHVSARPKHGQLSNKKGTLPSIDWSPREKPFSEALAKARALKTGSPKQRAAQKHTGVGSSSKGPPASLQRVQQSPREQADKVRPSQRKTIPSLPLQKKLSAASNTASLESKCTQSGNEARKDPHAVASAGSSGDSKQPPTKPAAATCKTGEVVKAKSSSATAGKATQSNSTEKGLVPRYRLVTRIIHDKSPKLIPPEKQRKPPHSQRPRPMETLEYLPLHIQPVSSGDQLGAGKKPRGSQSSEQSHSNSPTPTAEPTTLLVLPPSRLGKETLLFGQVLEIESLKRAVDSMARAGKTSAAEKSTENAGRSCGISKEPNTEMTSQAISSASSESIAGDCCGRGTPSRPSSSATDSHVKQLAADSHVNQPATDSRVKQPAADSRVKQPATDSRVKQPAADSHVNQPATDSCVKPPPADSRVNQPATDSCVKPPPADSRVNQPATDSRVKQPAADSHVNQPATDSRVKQPAADSHVNQPATDSRVKQPAADSRVTQPAASKRTGKEKHTAAETANAKLKSPTQCVLNKVMHSVLNEIVAAKAATTSVESPEFSPMSLGSPVRTPSQPAVRHSLTSPPLSSAGSPVRTPSQPAVRHILTSPPVCSAGSPVRTPSQPAVRHNIILTPPPLSSAGSLVRTPSQPAVRHNIILTSHPLSSAGSLVRTPSQPAVRHNIILTSHPLSSAGSLVRTPSQPAVRHNIILTSHPLSSASSPVRTLNQPAVRRSLTSPPLSSAGSPVRTPCQPAVRHSLTPPPLSSAGSLVRTPSQPVVRHSLTPPPLSSAGSPVRTLNQPVVRRSLTSPPLSSAGVSPSQPYMDMAASFSQSQQSPLQPHLPHLAANTALPLKPGASSAAQSASDCASPVSLDPVDSGFLPVTSVNLQVLQRKLEYETTQLKSMELQTVESHDEAPDFSSMLMSSDTDTPSCASPKHQKEPTRKSGKQKATKVSLLEQQGMPDKQNREDSPLACPPSVLMSSDTDTPCASPRHQKEPTRKSGKQKATKVSLLERQSMPDKQNREDSPLACPPSATSPVHSVRSSLSLESIICGLKSKKMLSRSIAEPNTENTISARRIGTSTPSSSGAKGSGVSKKRRRSKGADDGGHKKHKEEKADAPLQKKQKIIQKPGKPAPTMKSVTDGDASVASDTENMSVSSSQLSSSQEAVGGDGLTPHMKFASDITVLDKRDNELQEKLFAAQTQAVDAARCVQEAELKVTELLQQERQLTEQRGELTEEYKNILVEKQNLFSPPSKNSDGSSQSGAGLTSDLNFFTRMKTLSEKEQDLQLRLLHGNQLLEKVSMQKTREKAKLEKKAEKQKHVQNQLAMLMGDYKNVQREKQALLMQWNSPAASTDEHELAEDVFPVQPLHVGVSTHNVRPTSALPPVQPLHVGVSTHNVRPTSALPPAGPLHGVSTHNVRPTSALPPVQPLHVGVSTHNVRPTSALPPAGPLHGVSTHNVRPTSALPPAGPLHGVSTHNVRPTSALPPAGPLHGVSTHNVRPTSALPPAGPLHGVSTHNVRPTSALPPAGPLHGVSTHNVRPTSALPPAGPLHGVSTHNVRPTSALPPAGPLHGVSTHNVRPTSALPPAGPLHGVSTHNVRPTSALPPAGPLHVGVSTHNVRPTSALPPAGLAIPSEDSRHETLEGVLAADRLRSTTPSEAGQESEGSQARVTSTKLQPPPAIPGPQETVVEVEKANDTRLMCSPRKHRKMALVEPQRSGRGLPLDHVGYAQPPVSPIRPRGRSPKTSQHITPDRTMLTPLQFEHQPQSTFTSSPHPANIPSVPNVAKDSVVKVLEASVPEPLSPLSTEQAEHMFTVPPSLTSDPPSTTTDSEVIVLDPDHYQPEPSLQSTSSAVLLPSAGPVWDSDGRSADGIRQAWKAAQALSSAGHGSLVRDHETGVEILADSHTSEQSSPTCDSSRDEEEPEAGFVEYTPPHENSVLGVKLCMNRLYTCSSDKSVKVYDIETCKEIRQQYNHRRSVTCIEIFTYGTETYIVTGSGDKHIIMCNTNTGQVEIDFNVGSKVMCMLSRGSLLVAGLSNGYVHLIDLQNKSAISKWLVCECMKNRDISCLCIHGNSLFTASYDNTVTCWDVSEYTASPPLAKPGTRKTHQITSFEKLVLCMQIEGERIFCGSADTTLKIFSTETGQPQGEVAGHGGAVSGMSLSGKLLITACFDHFIRCYDTETLTLLQMYGKVPDLPFTLCSANEAVYCGLKDGKVISVKIDLSQYHQCQWEDCSLTFGIRSHLKQHLQDHLSCDGLSSGQCKWATCSQTVPQDSLSISQHVNSHHVTAISVTPATITLN